MSIIDLPTDLWHNIFKQLPLQSGIELNRTCKYFNNLFINNMQDVHQFEFDYRLKIQGIMFYNYKLKALPYQKYKKKLKTNKYFKLPIKLFNDEKLEQLICKPKVVLVVDKDGCFNDISYYMQLDILGIDLKIALDTKEMDNFKTLIKVKSPKYVAVRYLDETSAFTNVEYLFINNGYLIKSIDNLVNTKVIRILCSAISSIPSNNKIEWCELKHCYRLTDVSGLTNVKELYLDDCPNVCNIDKLINVTYMLLNNTGVKDIPLLPKFRDLLVMYLP